MRERTPILRFTAVGMLALRAALALGQQDPLYSQYMFNTLAFNPAYAGSADVFTAMALTRHQWTGFEGAPSTQTLSLHSPLPGGALAMGGNIIHDETGPATRNCAYLDVAYRIRTGHDTRLSFGLSGGATLFQADLASLRTVDVDPHNGAIEGKLMPNFGFGLYWHGPRFYLGLSAPKLLENRIGEDGAVVTGRELRHYFLMGGYVMDVSPGVKFRPTAMLRAVEGAPLSLDVDASLLLQDRIWLGAKYRWADAVGVWAQYRIDEQLRVGYAFEMTTSRIGAQGAGTHEIMIGYDFRFNTGRTLSPRYF